MLACTHGALKKVTALWSKCGPDAKACSGINEARELLHIVVVVIPEAVPCGASRPESDLRSHISARPH